MIISSLTVITSYSIHYTKLYDTFLWDDVGTWDSLAKYGESLSENAFPVESRGCYVQSDIPVALCGVDDLIVVIRNGKALVARKGETNLVKDALQAMKRKGLE